MAGNLVFPIATAKRWARQTSVSCGAASHRKDAARVDAAAPQPRRCSSAAPVHRSLYARMRRGRSPQASRLSRTACAEPRAHCIRPSSRNRVYQGLAASSGGPTGPWSSLDGPHSVLSCERNGDPIVVRFGRVTPVANQQLRWRTLKKHAHEYPLSKRSTGTGHLG